MHSKSPFQFEAIGTKWIIEIENSEKALEKEILQIIKDFEQTYSRFDERSLLSQINQKKYAVNLPVEFDKMLKFGLHVNEISGGLFNIGLGKVLEDLGYDSDYSFKVKDIKTQATEILYKNGKLKLGEFTKLDFGGFGKGWLVDKIAELLDKESIQEYLINAGGDIRIKSSETKKFYLEDPNLNNKYIGEISINQGGIASSSSNRRKWKAVTSGKEFNHIINYKDEIAASFTYAKNTLIADVAATICTIASPEILKNVQKELDFEFVILFKDGTFFKSSHYPDSIYERS